MRTALMILAWGSLLLPWQQCLAACHNRLTLSGHECHPGGRCSEKPGHEHGNTRDDRLSFDSPSPSPVPAFVPVVSEQLVEAVFVAAAIEAAAAADAPPAVPRTTVLLL